MQILWRIKPIKENPRAIILNKVLELSRFSNCIEFSKANLGTLEIPEYKFYTELLKNIINSSRIYGIPFQNALEELKRTLIKDDQFETKLKNVFKNTLLQFLVMSFITWFFIIYSSQLLNQKFNIGLYLIIATLHIAGIIVFYFVERIIKYYDFNHFALFFTSLCTMKSLFSIGLSYQKISELSQLDALLKLNKLESIKEKLILALKSFKERGTSILQDLEIIINDLQFDLEISFDNFCKKQNILKYVCLIVFYASSYFIFILNLVSKILFV